MKSSYYHDSQWLDKHRSQINAEETDLKENSRLNFFTRSTYWNNDVHLLDYMQLIAGAATIRIFLGDEEAVREGLTRLNKLLEQELEERRSAGKDENKVLRNVLERELTKLGFEKFGKATTFLPRSQFLFAVSQRIILKDPGAPDSHGEFTHAIQWLLIGWANEQYHFFSNNMSAADFYQKLGGQGRGGEKDSMLNPFAALWDITVDEEYSKLFKKDIRFTCPDRLMDFIVQSKDQNFSLLSQLFRDRQIKRQYSGEYRVNEEYYNPPKKRDYPKTEYEKYNDETKLLLPSKPKKT